MKRSNMKDNFGHYLTYSIARTLIEIYYRDGISLAALQREVKVERRTFYMDINIMRSKGILITTGTFRKSAFLTSKGRKLAQLMAPIVNIDTQV